MANTGMKIGHVNGYSLTPKINYIKDLLVLEDITSLGITETWLSYKIPKELVDIDGYRFYRAHRGSRGGTVGVYVRNNIDASKYQFTSQKNGALEALWLNVKVQNETIKIGFVYRPPIYTNLSESLNMLEFFLEIRPTCDEIVVLGDFNINLLDQGRASELLLHTLDTYELKQIVNDPTRKKSLLDIIAISNSDLVKSEVIHFDMHGITDHQLVLCNLLINLKKPPIKIKTYRDFRLFNFEEIERDLKQLEWIDLYNANNIEDKMQLFTKKLIHLFDNHAPLVTGRISKPKAEWYTDCIKVMTEERDRRLSKYKHTKN
nr:unnamed protein product [Callosobruchus analis]